MADASAGTGTRPTTMPAWRRAVQLPLGCIVLGLGVCLLLQAELGSDGYSTLMSGLSMASGWDFAIVSWLSAGVLVGIAWWRGQRPGPGTVAQLVLVGLTVSLVMRVLPPIDHLGTRIGLFAAGYLVLCVGVAAYLATDLGAGPAEAAALAFDPPLRFGWSYTIFQLIGVLVGWWCGAAVGVGTLILAAGIGWSIDRLIPLLGQPARDNPPGPDTSGTAR
ncbi:hypothetical protein [Janibacter sp. G56]|uniref:hypothetical protein n=1 Tax=Janibacter sp. G56 TaxID=3418717 RepID=UPI003CFC6DC0